MDANLYQLDGKVVKKIALPAVFSNEFRVDLVRRAILAEQSLRYQPQGHSVMAGLNTSSIYVGEYSIYRSGRHMGISIRPRQKLGGGGLGDVRRIPSAVKGRRAHPHKIEKRIVEHMNAVEYRKALESAIASASMSALVKAKHILKDQTLPIVIEDKIEGITKTKELMQVLRNLGLLDDIEKSHDPRIKRGMRRYAVVRRYRKSVLIVVKDGTKISKAGRNIPGVDVRSINELKVETLTPGSQPRVSIWSESAIQGVQEAIKRAKL